MGINKLLINLLNNSLLNHKEKGHITKLTFALAFKGVKD